MATAYAEDSALISDDRPTELRNIKTIIECDFVGLLAIDVPKVYGFWAPLKVVHIFVWAVRFLQNECILQKFTKFVNHIYFRVVSNSTIQFSELTHFEHQVLGDLVQLVPYEFESFKVPIIPILFQILDILLQFIQLLNWLRNFDKDTLLSVFTIF